METIGVEGRTLKDAIERACEQLSVGERGLKYKLDVDHFRDAFGKARGVDTVRILAWADGSVEETPAVEEAESVSGGDEPRARPERRERSERRERPERRERSERVQTQEPATSDDAPMEAPPAEGRRRAAPPVAPTPGLEGAADEVIGAFVGGALERMGVTASVSTEERDDRIYVSLTELDSGDMDQGRLGKALRSIEYLANRLSSSETDRLPRVSLSIEGDQDDERAEKEAYLEAVAGKVVAQVLKDERPLTLKPMNSYERRIIHLAVSRHEGVGSRSIGDGQRKRVQVYSTRSGADTDAD